jgi:hypothetical protein
MRLPSAIANFTRAEDLFNQLMQLGIPTPCESRRVDRHRQDDATFASIDKVARPAPAVLSRLNWSLALKEDQTMKRKRFTEEQIIGVLREHELGAKTADLCRKHGISEATFYRAARELYLLIGSRGRPPGRSSATTARS